MNNLIWRDDDVSLFEKAKFLKIFIAFVIFSGFFSFLFLYFFVFNLVLSGEFSRVALVDFLFFFAIMIFFLYFLIKIYRNAVPVEIFGSYMIASFLLSKKKIKFLDIKVIYIGRYDDVKSAKDLTGIVIYELYSRNNSNSNGNYIIIENKKKSFGFKIRNENGFLNAMKKAGFRVRKNNEKFKLTRLTKI
jgi:hypothetical protein